MCGSQGEPEAPSDVSKTGAIHEGFVHLFAINSRTNCARPRHLIRRLVEGTMRRALTRDARRTELPERAMETGRSECAFRLQATRRCDDWTSEKEVSAARIYARARALSQALRGRRRFPARPTFRGSQRLRSKTSPVNRRRTAATVADGTGTSPRHTAGHNRPPRNPQGERAECPGHCRTARR
jgi:hypothetical protein